MKVYLVIEIDQELVDIKTITTNQQTAQSTTTRLKEAKENSSSIFCVKMDLPVLKEDSPPYTKQTLLAMVALLFKELNSEQEQ